MHAETTTCTHSRPARTHTGAPKLKKGTHRGPPQRVVLLFLRSSDYLIYLAVPVRLERTTCRLEGGCSIQLSYGTRFPSEGREAPKGGAQPSTCRPHAARGRYS